MQMSRTPFAPFRSTALASILAALVFSLAAASAAFAADVETVGHVTRTQGLSYAVQGSVLKELSPNALINRKDVLRTGPGARLEITLLDETRLTLGADTEFSVERYDLGRQDGGVLLKLTKGAFRVATGQLEALRGGPFEVSTPLATIGIRGTDFWGGYLAADEISVLLISGKGVYIVNDGGRAEIVRPMEGLTVRSATAPPPAPSMWSPDKRQRAFDTVAFGK
ncbi:MAG TPA: FecR family protein [Humidesulfovibrio sp.]|uniref:FecR family protein n=1 Tax=Humidesulfovibrio sp. TaxID=2910988 RepID=UPI002BF22A56|nr:FecR family protein [Humidesulfovibrio sp.]HWR03036.1 FecR family protein [Humidesulfovibrio sp.]